MKTPHHLGPAIAITLAWTATAASAPPPEQDHETARLRSVMALYGIDAKAARARLSAEQAATEIYAHVRSANLPGHAGAWFDANSSRLTVAGNDSSARKRVVALGADFVSVSHSLDELESRLAHRLEVLTATLPAGILQSSNVHPISNGAQLHILADTADQVREALGEDADWIELIEISAPVELASGPVHGADGTINYDVSLTLGLNWFCSIGVSVNGGFLSAGHCYYVDPPEQANALDNSTLGVSTYSTFTPTTHDRFDTSFITTVPGWTPENKINGYSDGTLTIPAKSSGMLESPINATVCRYGTGSNGPHCGKIEAKNVTFYSPFMPAILGTTRVDSCVDNGDSGGPVLSASGIQVQGTVVGGAHVGACTTPNPDSLFYFQPIAISMEWHNHGDRADGNLKMLTAHGAAVPTVHSLGCFQATLTSYFCTLSHYNSQGATSLNWSSTGGGSGSGTYYEGNCATGNWATATVTATNPYGTSTALSKSVYCHSIIP